MSPPGRPATCKGSMPRTREAEQAVAPTTNTSALHRRLHTASTLSSTSIERVGRDPGADAQRNSGIRKALGQDISDHEVVTVDDEKAERHSALLLGG